MAVALLTVIAGALRFTGLGTQSLWFDEALTAIVLDSSLVETFETLRDREATPPDLELPMEPVPPALARLLGLPRREEGLEPTIEALRTRLS